MYGSWGTMFRQYGGWATTICFDAMVWVLDCSLSRITGEPHWGTMKRLMTLGISLLMLYVVLRIVNCVLIPFVYSALNLRRLWLFLRAGSDTSEDCTVNDLDWRGPGTSAPVDNDVYRDFFALSVCLCSLGKHT